MDSCASTSTSTTSLPTNYASPMSSTLTMSSPAFPSSFSTFRPSPLNPTSSQSVPDSSEPLRRSSSFPASRPLRPFPSIVRSMSSSQTHPPSSGDKEFPTREAEARASPDVPAKHPPKPLEISAKWRGGFFVLGMTQAEFSRQD